MDWSIPLIILQLILLEGLLSIDNAAVLGALVTRLPDDQPITWPSALRKVGHALDKVLGNQRMAALRVGLLGAYLGRGLMLLLASFIIHNPWLKIIGAAYLIHLAFDNLGTADESDAEGDVKNTKATSFWGVVVTVEIADLVFSLDNVVAAVSLSSRLWVVMLGVAIGILFMRFAAGIFSYLVEKEPVLKPAAYLLVMNIGIELLLEELAGIEIGDWTRFGISAGTIALALIYANVPFLKVLRPALFWFAQGFSRINGLINWAFIPIVRLVSLIFTGIGLLFRKPNQAVD